MPVHPLQQTLKDLERAYSNLFAKRADFPHFKKKGQSDSFRYPDPKQIKLDQANSRLFLPKLGWLRYRNSRDVLGTVKNITVSLSCGKWYVAIQTEREVEPPIPNGGAVGIDMGIARFATLSDGSHLEPLNSFKRHETALRKAQRAMSRKTQFSHNWKKAKARVQRIHSRIGNARRDYLHKATTTRGGYLVAVPPRNTSRTCPACGHVSADNRQTQARFECVECGYKNNADVVGAINVQRAGHARSACAETSPEVRASGQEPTEATMRFSA